MVKKSACNVGDLGSIPGLGRSPGEGKGYPLQYSGLENSMECMVHGVAKSQTQPSDYARNIKGVDSLSARILSPIQAHQPTDGQKVVEGLACDRPCLLLQGPPVSPAGSQNTQWLCLNEVPE